ncbi:MAG: hypothetical protein FWD55_02935, partial [Propionibacteriaceae bacterium]|nr:hypothetical protein [Propionibacteriaceae bacterium]
MTQLTRKTISALAALAVMGGVMTITPLSAHAANTTVTIVASDTVAGVKQKIDEAMAVSNSGDTVTVTGSKTDANSTLFVNMTPGVTLMWKATYSGSVDYPSFLVSIGSSVGLAFSFELASSGSIINRATGTTLLHGGYSITTKIAGTLTNTMGGIALGYRGIKKTTMDISGTVSATGNACAVLLDEFTDETTLTITGSVTSELYGEAIVAKKSEVVVKSGKVTAGSSNAINAYTVRISGGTVSSTGANPTVTALTVDVSGGSVNNTGSGTAIEAKAVDV